LAVLQLARVDVGAVWPEWSGVAAVQLVLSIVAGGATLSAILQAGRRRPGPTQRTALVPADADARDLDKSWSPMSGRAVLP
jgi:hypothetical protein